MEIKRETIKTLAINSGFNNVVSLSNTRQWRYMLFSFFYGIIFSIIPAIFIDNILNNWALILLMGAYFTLPANLLFNGVNYLCDLQEDFETRKMMDPNNPIYYPNSPDNIQRSLFTKRIWLWISFLNLPLLVVALFLNSGAFISVSAFVFFAIFYSAEPIRAKINLFLEPLFFSLYVFPFLISFHILNNTDFNFLLFVASILWAYASRVFFLICGRAYLISPNSLVQKLGYKNTVILIAIFYTLTSLCLIPFLSWFFIIPNIIFVYPVLKALKAPTIDFSTPQINQPLLKTFVRSNIIAAIFIPIIILTLNLLLQNFGIFR